MENETLGLNDRLESYYLCQQCFLYHILLLLFPVLSPTAGSQQVRVMEIGPNWNDSRNKGVQEDRLEGRQLQREIQTDKVVDAGHIIRHIGY